MARSVRSKCHPRHREPMPPTLRSSHLIRRPRRLRRRRRVHQHLLRDLGRALCVPMAPVRGLGPSDHGVDRLSPAADASLYVCANSKCLLLERSSPFPKAPVRRGAFNRDRRFPPIPSSPRSSRMWSSYRDSARTSSGKPGRSSMNLGRGIALLPTLAPGRLPSACAATLGVPFTHVARPLLAASPSLSAQATPHKRDSFYLSRSMRKQAIAAIPRPPPLA